MAAIVIDLTYEDQVIDLTDEPPLIDISNETVTEEFRTCKFVPLEGHERTFFDTNTKFIVQMDKDGYWNVCAVGVMYSVYKKRNVAVIRLHRPLTTDEKIIAWKAGFGVVYQE
jgi:predicted YcjX-like family ATPase